MLPGKKYAPEDFVAILRRRAWLVAVPFVLVSVGTLAGSQYLPDRYRSETLILVVPQRVPESYVKATVTTRIEDRLQSISQQILSRTRLERIIQDFNLYAEERQTGIMEDVVERMRKDIDVKVVKGDAFNISFSSDNARTAMQVTERLATLFIDENLKDRELLAVGTNQFLEAQLEEARLKLVEQEKKLEVYRRQFSGQLPSQLQPNMQALQNTQMQIQSVLDSLNRDRDRKLVLEQLLSDREPVIEPPAQPAAAGTAAPMTGTAAQQLDQARRALAALGLRLKPDHPDIRRLQRTIADLEARVALEVENAPADAAAAPIVADPREAARLARFRELSLELESVTRQIALKEGEERRLRDAAAAYQARIDAVPSRESELAELTRDYETMQKVYQDLLAKKQDSQVAANLERRQIGEQFKVLDVARLPEKPFSPNRLLINAGGVGAGLALGLGLVFLFEYRDRSFRSQGDVAAVLGLPVMATVPQMSTADERRRRRRRRVLAWSSAAAIACTAIAASAWLFRNALLGWWR
jgi:polysaccharide chain length determinant protein (PEP-CTERM system associated)